jgi:fluoroquinolone resistance protein
VKKAAYERQKCQKMGNYVLKCVHFLIISPLCYIFNCKMITKKKVFLHKEIQGEDFEDTAFQSCKFIGLSFKFVNFQNCTFKNCDFSESRFDFVGFSNCSFSESKLSFLDFSNTSVQNCDFANSVAENCVFQKLKGGSKNERKNFDLRSCNFEGANLNGTIFVICNLKKVNFQKSILENAVFERCDLEETDFTLAKIAGCGFSDCNIKKTYLDMNGFLDYGNSKGFVLR